MTDVKALAILSEQIDNFRKLPEAPTSFDEAEAYTNTLRKASDVAQKAVEKVKGYVENVEAKVTELRGAQQAIIKQNQDAIQRIFSQFKPVTKDVVYDERTRKRVVDQLKLAHSLQQATRDLMNDRLNELMEETELVCGRVQDGASLYTEEVDSLKGCLDNWRNAKVQSYEEEKRIAEEERRRKEEAERRRKEEEARRKQEEEERRKKEEEERKRREKEEAERRAEEERLRREEEERIRQEEVERKRREEDERIQHEADEKRLREEEERRKRDEEEARRKAEEQRRRDEEKREKDRQRKEEEERAWRRDPNNWKPVVYDRKCDEVDGRREYHGGISCVLASPPDGIEKDDIECNASDEVDSVITVLEDDEKPVSSVIDVQSNKDNILHSEVPSRLYIPHNRILAPSDEIVIKISKDGNDWMTFSPVQPTQNMSELEKSAKRMAGVEVNDFTSLKLIVISRPKSQTIIVDRPGVSVYSAVDNNVKLFVPRDTFETKTEMRMMVQTVAGDTLSGLRKDNPSLENVLSVSSIITLISQKAPRKSIEVDLLKPTSKQAPASRFQRGKFYQLIACRDKAWRIADVEYKGQQNHVTVSLPVGRDKVTIMEIEVPANMSKDNVPGIAEALQASINKTTSVLVVKQKSSNPKTVAVRIVRKEDLKYMIDYLEEFGFDDGPGVSGDFKIKEGQTIQIFCIGNIETDPDQNIVLEYMSYKGGAATTFSVKVKDVYKQKDLPSFVGNIRCILLKDKHSDMFTYSVEMTVSLPKLVREKTVIGFVRVRFPYYLTLVASYLAKAVRKDDTIHWESILKTLMGDKGFESGFRNAKRKFEESAEDAIIFKAILTDWMKAQHRHEDKLVPVMDAVKRNGHAALANQCEEYVAFQKVNLSDDVIKEISSEASRPARDLGQDLGLADSVIDKCVQVHKDDTSAQIEAVLIEWRETDDVLRHENAQVYLRSVSG